MKEVKKRIILDLCGGTGSWSKPYKKTGYEVYNLTLPDYDLKETIINNSHICFGTKEKWDTKGGICIFKKSVYGILAAPPCTMFSLARTKAKKPRDLKEGMELVRICLDIIWSCMEVKQPTKYKTVPLKFWALENPNGMLKYFLGKPAFEFDPYEFGDGYKKRTYIWGWFNDPEKKVGEIGFHSDYNHEKLSKFDKLKTKEIHPEYYGKLSRTERRAITPTNFARAFFDANK